MILKTGYWRRGLSARYRGASDGSMRVLRDAVWRRTGAAGVSQGTAAVGARIAALSASARLSNYACGGKVYTAFQLAKLREDWEKNHGG